MWWTSPEARDIFRFWVPLVGLSLIGIGALVYEVRRLRCTVREVVGALLVLPLMLGCVIVVGKVGDVGLSWFEALPKHSRAVIQDRISLVVFLFWLALLGYLAFVAVYAVIASCAIIGWFKDVTELRRVGRSRSFAAEYWVLVDRRAELGLIPRIGILLHHLLFSLAWLCFAGCGLMMTFGVPWFPVARYAVLALVVALALNPDWVDRRLAKRLAAADEQRQLLEKWT